MAGTAGSLKPKCPICVTAMCQSRQFTCPGCQFVCCKICMRTYVLNSLEPSCMNTDCRRVFSIEILLEQLPDNFRSQYKDHLANIELEKERQRLPDMIAKADNALKLRRLENKISKAKAVVSTLEMDRNFLLANTANNQDPEETRRVFMKKCASETCNGFLTSNYKCRLCEKTTCLHCGVIWESADHQCLQANIDTVNLLKSDTKNCPKCAVPIFRSSGCPQMFCVRCHTAFDWTSLKIINGPIHNPHYFEIMQALALTNQTGAQQPIGLDVPCDIQTQDNLRQLFSARTMFLKGNPSFNSSIQRSLMHLLMYSLPEFMPVERIEQQKNKFRLAFLLSNSVIDEETGEQFPKFDEEQWLYRIKLQQSELLRTKSNHDILQTYLFTMGDLLLKLNSQDPDVRPQDVYNEMNTLRKLVNRSLAKNCKSLGVIRRKVVNHVRAVPMDFPRESTRRGTDCWNLDLITVANRKTGSKSNPLFAS